MFQIGGGKAKRDIAAGIIGAGIDIEFLHRHQVRQLFAPGLGYSHAVHFPVFTLGQLGKDKCRGAAAHIDKAVLHHRVADFGFHMLVHGIEGIFNFLHHIQGVEL